MNLLSLLSTFEDPVEPSPEPRVRDEASAGESKLPRTNSLEDLGIATATAVPAASAPGGTDGRKKQGGEEEEVDRKWAVPVNITAPCQDFHKRIPEPAFKVRMV